MRTLKIILHYNFFYYILLCLTIIYLFFYFDNQKIVIKDENNLSGVVIEKLDHQKYILYNQEKVLVYFKEEQNFKIGDYLNISGKYNIPPENTNFNLFNYRLYLKTKKTNYLFYEDSHVITHKVKRIDYYIKNKVNERVDNLNSPFINSFILGKNNELSSVYQDLQITHLFAISGFHIGIILMFLNKKINPILLIFILFIYLFLTGFTISFLRAYLFYLLIKINDYFNLNVKKENILLLLMTFFIIYNPYIIYSIAFQLSFINVFFLIKYSNFFKRFDNYFIKGFYISLIASLVSFPIIIYHFYQYNLISILLTPIVSLFVVILYIISIFSFILNNSNFLNFIVYHFDQILNYIASFDTNLVLGRTPLIYIFIYYLVNLFIINQFLYKRYYMIAIFFLVIGINIITNNYSNSLKVYMIDVGQGDSIFVHHKDSKILIDTGGVFNNEKYSYYNVIPFLKSLGITKIDYLIITHGDLDHSKEAINILENFKINNIIMNNNGDTLYEKAIVDYSLNNKINVIRSPKTIESKGLILKFYNTDKKDENNSSLFFSVNNKILFTGDAYISDELEYLPNLKHYPILKVGHHGSKTSTSSDFLNKINPSISLVSVGRNNRFNHPSWEVVARLNNFYLTSENGMIYLKIDREIKIKTKF